jgi:hypothetical protein
MHATVNKIIFDTATAAPKSENTKACIVFNWQNAAEMSSERPAPDAGEAHLTFWTGRSDSQLR